MVEPLAAVLIPCKDEEQAIGQVVTDFREQIPYAKVYVGDNLCQDRTVERAAKAGATVIPCPDKGKGNAMKTMLRAVKAQYYIIVDGDGTYSAADAERLLDLAVKHHLAMAIGDRLHGVDETKWIPRIGPRTYESDYFKENKSILHAMGNRLVPKMVQEKCGGPLLDVMSGLRVIRRDFLLECPIESSGFTVETELTMKLLRSGLPFHSLPISYHDRSMNSHTKVKSLQDGGKIIAWILTH